MDCEWQQAPYHLPVKRENRRLHACEGRAAAIDVAATPRSPGCAPVKRLIFKASFGRAGATSTAHEPCNYFFPFRESARLRARSCSRQFPGRGADLDAGATSLSLVETLFLAGSVAFALSIGAPRRRQRQSYGLLASFAVATLAVRVSPLCHRSCSCGSSRMSPPRPPRRPHRRSSPISSRHVRRAVFWAGGALVGFGYVAIHRLLSSRWRAPPNGAYIFQAPRFSPRDAVARDRLLDASRSRCSTSRCRPQYGSRPGAARATAALYAGGLLGVSTEHPYEGGRGCWARAQPRPAT